MITGTYNLRPNSSWSLMQLQEIRLECDTTTGPVTINLPAIQTLAQSTNIKLFIVDVTGNASVNNITINSGSVGAPPVFDTFDDATTTQLVLDTNGSSVALQNVASTQWFATESITGIPNTTPVWDLKLGVIALGGDARVASDLQKIPETLKDPTTGDTIFLYNLKGYATFSGAANVYAHYVGLITVDLGKTLYVADNSSIVKCTDAALNGEIDSTLANGAWVRNTATNTAEQTPFVMINPDNTPGNPNQYYIYLLTGNPNNFDCLVNFDITFATTSLNVTYTQNI